MLSTLFNGSLEFGSLRQKRNRRSRDATPRSSNSLATSDELICQLRLGRAEEEVLDAHSRSAGNRSRLSESYWAVAVFDVGDRRRVDRRPPVGTEDTDEISLADTHFFASPLHVGREPVVVGIRPLKDLRQKRAARTTSHQSLDTSCEFTRSGCSRKNADTREAEALTESAILEESPDPILDYRTRAGFRVFATLVDTRLACENRSMRPRVPDVG